ncbi:hypothetical protein BKH46_05875 [Helicobacter sp. 12S02634-8]|uniref:hypothetical protein n=1 Tax=Helicobacter sp. 12S02634-8 TaxID=1476199 RepID=UPI000BA6F187|nr:hypothetical protein [Helicobacter sp. 12S02634-8]PAF46964.1 hypothetical protein BKH46_05875 [Helicobacter sp. 12S02634-8]
MARIFVSAFFREQRGAIAIIVAILAPLIIGLLALAFDGASMFVYQARLQDALREATLGAYALQSEGEKRLLIQNYLKSYFYNKNLKFSNIKSITETIATSTQQGANTQEILTTSADLLLPAWFRTQLDGISQGKLQAMVSLEPTSQGGDRDYLFVLDFSSSMRANFLVKSSEISFCQPQNPDYDPQICSKLNSGGNRAEVMQAIILKIIKTINATQNNRSEFAFLPFYAGSQIQKEHTYALIRGNHTSSSASKETQQASYYVLQATFKPEFILTDYDFWSGVVTNRYARIDSSKMNFDAPPYADHPERDRALKFFRAFTQEQSNIIFYNLKEGLPKVIDYEATLQNMFDPQKAFSFRFYSTMDSNPLNEGARINGVAYDYYSRSSNIESIIDHSMYGLRIKFYEENFKPIPHPESLKILNEKPFDTKTEGGGLTLVSTALLRGAAMLNQGRHKKRAMIVVTDGVDAEGLAVGDPSRNPLVDMEERLYAMGLCQRIRDGMRTKGVEAEIFFINIAKKSDSQETLRQWKACAGEGHAEVVENIDEFLNVFKKFIFGNELGRFIDKNKF